MTQERLVVVVPLHFWQLRQGSGTECPSTTSTTRWNFPSTGAVVSPTPPHLITSSPGQSCATVGHISMTATSRSKAEHESLSLLPSLRSWQKRHLNIKQRPPALVYSPRSCATCVKHQSVMSIKIACLTAYIHKGMFRLTGTTRHQNIKLPVCFI
jgi:hypothetical protein